MTETQKSCSDWASETFGPPSTLLSVATRAFEECAELIRELGKDRLSLKARAECADIVIILYRLAERTGGQMSVDHKLGTEIIGVVDSADDDAAMWCANWCARHLLKLIEELIKPVPDMGQVHARLDSVGSLLAVCCALLGTRIEREVDAKMAINRKRRWNLSGDGHGYHVKEPPGPNKCKNGVWEGQYCVYPRTMFPNGPRKCTRCGEPEVL